MKLWEVAKSREGTHWRALESNWLFCGWSGAAARWRAHRLTHRATDFLVNMSASADVLAQAKVEIDLAAIPEGKNVRIWLELGYLDSS